MSDAEELLTAEQVAEILKVGRTKVFALIARGELRSMTIDRCRRIPRSEVDAFIARRLQEASREKAA